jgi:hypothetical protein
MSSTPYDRVVVRCPSMRLDSWSFLGMLHTSTQRSKVNKFLFGLNFNIHTKVTILIPQMLHNPVQKALIAKEELTNGGQGRTPAILTRKTKSGVQQHQTLSRNKLEYQDTSRGPTFTTPR